MHHPEYPGFEDFGDVMLRGDGGSGYIRVDWFTPDGLQTWGDTRLTVLGTDGYIEVRKNIDIAGRPGSNHLFLVDQKETRYIDTSNTALPFGERLVDDVLNRTETSMPQAHVFLVMELALKSQKQALRIGGRGVSRQCTMQNAQCTECTMPRARDARCTMHNARCRTHNEQPRSHPDARRARLHSGLLLEALP